MTAKRDLKRRVRQRQARTGESYVTARRRVIEARAEGKHAGRNEPTEPEPAAQAALPVVELHDLTREAWQVGFRCRVTVYPSVLEACEVADVLTALRDALVGAGGDPGRARMFDVAFGVRSKPERYAGEAVMTFPVAGRGGTIQIRCWLWQLAPSLMLRRADEPEPGILDDVRPVVLARFERELQEYVMSQLPGDLFSAAQRPLFVIFGRLRTQITKRQFVIGRDHKVVDLAIPDDEISRTHAAVVYRRPAYYLKDLGSMNGILFKGMRIDNKRIDEGDVFHLARHALRFTFRPA